MPFLNIINTGFITVVSTRQDKFIQKIKTYYV